MNAPTLRKIIVPDGYVQLSLVGDRVVLSAHSWADFIPFVLTAAQAREIAEAMAEYVVAADQAAAALVAHVSVAQDRG